MASRSTDQPLLDGIKELIERMQDQRLRSIPSKESKAASAGDWPGSYPLPARRSHPQPACEIDHVAQRD
jgi:hypothetical protein